VRRVRTRFFAFTGTSALQRGQVSLTALFRDQPAVADLTA
jgi:hypothetical protein